jgi:ankyrin repeat protein
MPSVDDILGIESPAFARAAIGVITGDAEALRAELEAHPGLIRARSVAPHRATLLHYVSANGIESELQFAVPNADEIAELLLAAGAEADAPCDAYEGRCRTTMNLVASSDHPANAGVAGRLVHVLCAHGAAADGPEGDGSPLATALLFANLDCVDALAARGAQARNAVFAAAIGDAERLAAWLDGGMSARATQAPAFFPLSPDPRIAAEQALVFASMCGEIDCTSLLLERGVDVNASPPGSHWTATPLHTAAVQGQTAIVELLLRRGADPSIKDARYGATAAQWIGHARPRRRPQELEVARLLERR